MEREEKREFVFNTALMSVKINRGGWKKFQTKDGPLGFKNEEISSQIVFLDADKVKIQMGELKFYYGTKRACKLEEAFSLSELLRQNSYLNTLTVANLSKEAAKRAMEEFNTAMAAP